MYPNVIHNYLCVLGMLLGHYWSTAEVLNVIGTVHAIPTYTRINLHVLLTSYYYSTYVLLKCNIALTSKHSRVPTWIFKCAYFVIVGLLVIISESFNLVREHLSVLLPSYKHSINVITHKSLYTVFNQAWMHCLQAEVTRN